MKARCPHRCPWFAACYECEPLDAMLTDSRRPLGNALAEAVYREMLGSAKPYVRMALNALGLEASEDEISALSELIVMRDIDLTEEAP